MLFGGAVIPAPSRPRGAGASRPRGGLLETTCLSLTPCGGGGRTTLMYKAGADDDTVV
jgi:hypothetical protein